MKMRTCSICGELMSYSHYKQANKTPRNADSFTKQSRDVAGLWNNDAVAIPCCKCLHVIHLVDMTRKETEFDGKIGQILSYIGYSNTMYRNLLKFGIITRDDVQAAIDNLASIVARPGSRVPLHSANFFWRKSRAVLDFQLRPNLFGNSAAVDAATSKINWHGKDGSAFMHISVNDDAVMFRHDPSRVVIMGRPVVLLNARFYQPTASRYSAWDARIDIISEVAVLKDTVIINRVIEAMSEFLSTC